MRRNTTTSSPAYWNNNPLGGERDGGERKVGAIYPLTFGFYEVLIFLLFGLLSLILTVLLARLLAEVFLVVFKIWETTLIKKGRR